MITKSFFMIPKSYTLINVESGACIKVDFTGKISEIFLVRDKGFEPLTSRSEDERSIQLKLIARHD